jgi:hypothetical protein
MMNETGVMKFFERLNHGAYGLTELVAMDALTGRVMATGWFSEKGAFVSACQKYGDTCNLFAGRNPRPCGFASQRNVMITKSKHRASDKDITHITAISLDIDPIRPVGKASSKGQHQTALAFALDMQWDLGGAVDDSGNGAHIWLVFETPILVRRENASSLKARFAFWQRNIKQKYRPERYGLRIDGCYDFSRLKRVTGSFNHKAKRYSNCIRQGHPSDKIRDEILATQGEHCQPKVPYQKVNTSLLPKQFMQLLSRDPVVRRLWRGPRVQFDRSGQDWLLGQCCLAAGIKDMGDLSVILKHRPHGKYSRDQREDYVRTTVDNLLRET